MNYRFLLFAIVSLLCAVTAHAQYEIKASNFNAIYTPYNGAGAAATPFGPPVGTNQGTLGATPNSNYRGIGNVSGSSSISDATPADGAPGAIPSAHADRFPANPEKTIVLLRCTIGGMFASGVPRYFLGDQITPPLVRADGVTPAVPGYWRLKPVLPGEPLTPYWNGTAVVSNYTPTPFGEVTVTSAATDRRTVTISGVAPPQLVVGATMLGEAITSINGTTVTLSGNAKQNINSSTLVFITPMLSYYYSPHSEKVYASQAGRTTVMWVTLNPTTNGGYETLTETFAVSSNTVEPVRTIFWSEGSFDGPKVQINDNRITTVSPAYYGLVPKAVPQEVDIPGYTPITPNLSTLSFDRFNGIGQLHAYNVEGRVLIEYLGNIRLPGNIYESLGTDVVEIKRVPTVTTLTVNLGDELQPHDFDGLLRASPVLSGAQQAATYYGTVNLPDGTQTYFAERETSAARNPDDGAPASDDAYNKVVFYWLETGEFNIRWPKYQDRYWQRWSPNLADYAHYTVGSTGSTPATGITFTGNSLPQVICEDAPTGKKEANIDLATQRFHVTFAAGADKVNRALLKFSSDGVPWYVNVYSQADDRAITANTTGTGTTTVTVAGGTTQLEAGMVVTGAGISGYATIIKVLSATQVLLSQTVGAGTTVLTYTVQADAGAPINATAQVGNRLVAPVGHEIAGGITGGGGYYPAGYLNPFTVGVEAANAGAIIPVNALPTDNVLTVRWFKKVAAPSASFQDIYVPGKVGRYTVSYPSSPVNATGGMAAARAYHVSALLGNGKVLVAGGQNGSTVFSSAELYDAATGAWTTTGNLAAVRHSAAATVLSNGKVMVVGGSGTGSYLGTAEIYDATAGTWSAGATLATARSYHTATALANNKVLIAGGVNGASLNSTQIYEADGLTFSSPAPPAMGTARYGHGAVLLPNGKVLIVGGRNSSSYLSSAELYNPATNTWAATGSLTTARSWHTTTLLANGKVLVTGGETSFGNVQTAEIYDPTTGFWTAAAFMFTARSYHTATLLANGRVLVAGGNPSWWPDLAVNRVEIYDPVANSWSGLDSLGTSRAIHQATLLGNGKVLVSGGYPYTASAELIDPAASFAGDTIVIASGVGTDDLAGPQAAGSIYYQNNPALPGYNPNEEHALMLGGRAYALRDDLNVTSGANYTSHPYVLLAYTDAVDERPAIRAFRVESTSAQYDFDYTATAGTLLVKPYPLPLLPAPLVGTVSKDVEFNTTYPDYSTNRSVNTSRYDRFTFNDRKGFTWVYRGPHANGTPALGMKLYYKSQAGFYLPGATNPNPAVGTILPFLRNSYRRGQPLNINAINWGSLDEPLTIRYTAAWPTDAPEMRIGETLTLPKFGLPQVRGQASAEVFYQQSLAVAETSSGNWRSSVILHDPTREKTTPIDKANIGLTKLPADLRTTSYQGRTYFQGLPPHLQKRFYFDPVRGTAGTLVLIGEFHDELAGEDYLDLNVLSLAEIAALKGLLAVGATGKSQWDAAIDDVVGSYRYTWTYNAGQWTSVKQTIAPNVPAEVTSSDNAVDSYALTATGQGAGYVTLVFGNGNNPDAQPTGDPVAVQVIKVAPQLYTGDLKVVQSSNPLDEQVTLRHSGDFAAHPEDYEFEWRWATGEATAPAVYGFSLATKLGDPAATPSPTNTWNVVRNPKAIRPGYGGSFSVPFPRSENVRAVNYVLDEQNNPTDQVIEASSHTDADIAANFPALYLRSNNYVDFSAGVPGTIIFSAELGALDGFIVYVNGRTALAHQAPPALAAQTNASSDLSPTGLTKQFAIAPSFFSQSYSNYVEVAVYSGAAANTFSTLDFKLEAAVEEDAVTSVGSVWQPATDPTGKNTNMAIVGGSPTNPFGGPQFVLNDRWFTMRYRAKQLRADGSLNPAYYLTGGTSSRWLPPQFVEGWIKRVLAAINPFEQRVKDLFNNQVNTDISVLTQAGTRWEGDVALTLDNINDVGLIAIYETVLNRAKNMSIDANTNDPDTNNALLLAAGYLNDLYTIIGNEAFADAANPTISLDDQSTVTEVNTSRFSFEGQVSSSLSEEMALLRGRDDLVSPGVLSAPAYNRLYWNYTHGINSGEVLYAVNYNIKEKVGSSTANGIIDEADAQRMFPQGHGDAYGHYLTALTGYYRLLTHPNFTWPVRAEAVTVAGQPVTVDFMDERKFAAAAGLLARTAQQVCSLTYREAYKDDPAAGWNHFRDDTGTNPQTQTTRRQGLDEWASRSAQGSLYHWVVANAMLPDQDTYHAGVQKIDRGTVLEIPELVSYVTSFQTTVDNANARLNPLGLSPGAIAFDISPAQLQAGQSHFEQIYDRALRSLINAAGSFNQASRMTRLLRNQENQTGDYNTVIAQQERAYVNQLIDIYGRPYSGEIGAGKLYAQGWEGPDLFHWFIVDRPNDLVNTSGTFNISINEAYGLEFYSWYDIGSSGFTNPSIPKTVAVQPSQFVQYNDVWKAGGLGSRAETGELQDALQDAQMTWLKLSEANVRYRAQATQMNQFVGVFRDLVRTHKAHLSELGTRQSEILALERLVSDLEITASSFELVGTAANDLAEAVAEFLPQTVGLATDVTSPARGAARLSGAIAATIARATAVTMQAGANFQRVNIVDEAQQLDKTLTQLGFAHEEVQMAYEFANQYRAVHTHAHELMQLSLGHQRALENVRNVMATGVRILEEREIFRQRAAAIVQGYRTKDLTFRVFRNEALEQYRSLFDLASRYTYLAAKSYDYETGLLGTSQGQVVFGEVVGARSLGDVQAGTPLSTVSSLGDSGLAGVMAKLFSDFSVAEGRLGINNPDQNGTVFSLRGELFRLLDDPNTTADDDAWRQTLEQHIVANVMTDSDVATFCRNIKKPDGTPVPGFVIPFSTTIQHAKNLFGLDLAAGDHNYTPSNYATKIYSVGVALPGYVGMDTYAAGNMGGGTPASGAANALSATPYCYLIPCGNDYMLAPPLGDTNTLRTWTVHDQALPLPFNLGANDFNSTQFFNANGTLSEQPWILRKHQAFRPVGDATFFYSSAPAEFTNTRLVGRSVWNSQWKLVIPAYTLLNNEQNALDRFTASVKDIQIFLRTYSHSGN